MPKSVDRIPPMPRIQAIDPRRSEQSWESAPQLLAALKRFGTNEELVKG